MVPQHAHAHARPQHLQQRHSRQQHSRQPPDPVRIAGISGTLALNVAALLLLLIPVSQTALLAPADAPAIPIRWIEEAPKPPPPLPPLPVETVQPQQQPRQMPPPALVRPEPAPLAVTPVIVEHGSLPAPPIIEGPPGLPEGTGIDPGPPASGMRLEYAHATPPPYPGAALRSQLQGTVLLEVLVDTDGSPLRVSIHRSSGHRTLDDSARRHVLRHWRFNPAVRDGQPIQAIGIVPIDFHLDRM